MVFGFYNGRRENQAAVLHKHWKQQQQLRNWDVTADWHAMAIIRDALVQPPYFSSFRFLMAPGEFPAVFPDKRPLSGHLILDNSIPCLLFSNWLSSKCDMVAKNHRVIDRYVLILWKLTAAFNKNTLLVDGLFAFDPIQFWRVFIHCLRAAHKNGL